jgi:hypothetical protein
MKEKTSIQIVAIVNYKLEYYPIKYKLGYKLTKDINWTI